MKIKRVNFVMNDRAFNHWHMAVAYRCAAQIAGIWKADPRLVGSLREAMRLSALESVRFVRSELRRAA